MTDVLIAKQQSLERCLARVRHAWEQPSTLPFERDYDRQDIVALNLQRACEQDRVVEDLRRVKILSFRYAHRGGPPGL